MTTVKTKQGDMEVMGAVPGELLGQAAQPKRPNKVAGEVTFEDHQGREVRLRPTFEAALEIEDQLGGLEPLRTRHATRGLAGGALPGLTARNLGVIIAAGVRAAGEPRADAEAAAKFVFHCGRDRLQEPVAKFLRALVDGGQLREDDLKNAASSNGWSSESDASELFEDLTATHSADTLGSQS